MVGQSDALKTVAVDQGEYVWPRGDGPDKRDDYCLHCGVPFADSDVDAPERQEWAVRCLTGVNADLCRQCHLNGNLIPSEWFTVRAAHEYDVFVYYISDQHWPHEHNPTIVAPLGTETATESLSFDSLTNHEQQLTAAIATDRIRVEYDCVPIDDIKRDLLHSVDPRLSGRDGCEQTYALPEYPKPCVFTTGGVYTNSPDEVRSVFGGSAADEEAQQDLTAVVGGTDSNSETGGGGGDGDSMQVSEHMTTQDTLF